jgi:hypothetical protein
VTISRREGWPRPSPSACRDRPSAPTRDDYWCIGAGVPGRWRMLSTSRTP